MARDAAQSPYIRWFAEIGIDEVRTQANPEHLLQFRQVRQSDLDHRIEPSRADQGGIAATDIVACRDQKEILVSGETVCKFEKA